LSAINGDFYNDQCYNLLEKMALSGGHVGFGAAVAGPSLFLCRKGMCRNEVTGILGYF